MKKKLAILTFLLLLPNLTLAADNIQSFSAKPSYPNKNLPYQFTVEMKPGSTDTETIGIFNSADQPYSFIISGVDSVLNQKGETTFKLGTDTQTDVGRWITTPKDPIVIPANSGKNVDFQVNVPANAAKKDYLGGISVQTTQVEHAQKSGQPVKVNLRTVSNLNLKVTDTPKPVEKAPIPPLFTPVQLYLGFSIILFVVVCAYFAIKAFKKPAASKAE